MSIEKEIFKKSVFDYEKLIAYGFQKRDEKYILIKKILNDTFLVNIEISSSKDIVGKIYDLSFGEEYTNFRVESITGSFVTSVREEFKKILTDIRDNCTHTNFFLSEQANRITHLIIQKYGDIPHFAWAKFPGYGVFKNHRNNKWYGVIMNIDINKIDNGSGEVEILDVKLDKSEIEHLLKRKGFYKAYHMNKENWITMILDNSIDDEEIMMYIDESHRFSVSNIKVNGD